VRFLRIDRVKDGEETTGSVYEVEPIMEGNGTLYVGGITNYIEYVDLDLPNSFNSTKSYVRITRDPEHVLDNFGGCDNQCYESDFGEKEQVVGYLNDYEKEIEYIDYCLSSDLLNEYYCSNGNAKSKTIACTGGEKCRDGRCIDCVEDWQCTNISGWSDCQETQYHERNVSGCYDKNQCGTTNDLPQRFFRCSEKELKILDRAKIYQKDKAEKKDLLEFTKGCEVGEVNVKVRSTGVINRIILNVIRITNNDLIKKIELRVVGVTTDSIVSEENPVLEIDRGDRHHRIELLKVYDDSADFHVESRPLETVSCDHMYQDDNEEVSKEIKEESEVEVPGFIKLGETKVETSLESIEENGKRFIKTPNGRKEIKILPKQAILNANLEKATKISIIEENGRAVYKIQGLKKVKLFYLFQIDANIEQTLDIETGEILSTKKPWWRFWAKGI
jgi:hypothetical protein